jgi:Tfp pilus assembly protein PilO
MDEQTSTSRPKVLMILLVIVIIVLLIWIFFQRNQMNKLIAGKELEKTELQYELDSLIKEHNQIKEVYGTLSDSLSAKDSIIQANAIEIRRLLDTEWEYNKARKRIASLQKIAQGYVHQLDSLYTINRELTAENEKIRQDFRTEQNRTQTLIKDKEQLSEKMNQAAFIKAYDVTATTYKLKGGEKEQPTDKASRTDRVRVCFTIGENPLVQSGKKIIYIRISRPDNVVVIKSKYDTFIFNGQTVPYSIREDIEYTGKSMNLCVNWTKRNTDVPAMKGKYTVTVFTEHKEIGSGTFELR